MYKRLKTLVTLCLCTFMGHAQKYAGGDISLLPTYEQHGVRYLDRQERQVQPLTFMATQTGWNAMRVRLFVDPAKAPEAHRREGVRQDLDYVTQLCRRIRAEGMAVMLNFHYSDTWTDPGQHATPSAWNSSDPAVLADSVYQYTKRCLQHLKAHAARPDFIQVGNEITNGMMWPTGHCIADGRGYEGGSFANMVAYLQAGVKACKETCPEAKIVLHTELGSTWSVEHFYETIGTQVDYDIIGLSYYPDHHGPLVTLEGTLATLERQQPGRDIMIVETGYGAQYAIGSKHAATVQQTWPLTEEGQRKFASDLVDMLNRHDRVTGLFWWMPEDNEYGADKNPARSSWWNASLYNQTTGRPYAAMFELQRFAGQAPTDIRRMAAAASDRVYNLSGQPLESTGTLPPGIYIKGGKKVLTR